MAGFAAKIHTATRDLRKNTQKRVFCVEELCKDNYLLITAGNVLALPGARS